MGDGDIKLLTKSVGMEYSIVLLVPFVPLSSDTRFFFSTVTPLYS